MKSPKTQLAELDAELVRLKQESGAAQMRVAEAESRRYDLNRQIARSQKPTPAMMALLKELFAGGMIKRNRYQSNSYYIEKSDGHTARIRSSLFYGLRDREVIAQSSDKDIYRITSHGRHVIERFAE